MPLRVHWSLPDGLLDLDATALHQHLGGPTLVHVPGRRLPALFVSVLLHGNETSGWDGLRRFLRENPRPDRALTVFIGNTAAAAQGVRALPGQPDYNRIWGGAEEGGVALPAALQTAIAGQPFFASVDLHNNTGHNPYYAVVTDLSPANLGLAQLFSDKAVYVEEPDTVLTRVFDGRCPAVALEVGPVGDPRCADRVVDLLGRTLLLDAIADAEPGDLSLFRTRVRVHIREDVLFAFEGELPDGGEGVDLTLTGGVEAVNFHELAAGSVFGTSRRCVNRVLEVLDVNHADVTEAYFARDGQKILLTQPVVPAMYTTDAYVIRQDCLCYFMERLTL
jgi:hypothetical protein